MIFLGRLEKKKNDVSICLKQVQCFLGRPAFLFVRKGQRFKKRFTKVFLKCSHRSSKLFDSPEGRSTVCLPLKSRKGSGAGCLFLLEECFFGGCSIACYKKALKPPTYHHSMLQAIPERSAKKALIPGIDDDS